MVGVCLGHSLHPSGPRSACLSLGPIYQAPRSVPAPGQWRSITSATGCSIIRFLGVAGCGFLSLAINMLKRIKSFSKRKKLGSHGTLIVLVEKR